MSEIIMEESLLQKSKRILKEQGPAMVVKKGWAMFLRQLEPLRIIFYPYAKWDLPRHVEGSYTAETAIDFVNNRYGGYIPESRSS